MALVGFHYEPMSLNVNKVCFKEEQNTWKIKEKSKRY